MQICNTHQVKKRNDLENTSRLILEKVGNDKATPDSLEGIHARQDFCVRVTGVLYQEKKRKILYLTTYTLLKHQAHLRRSSSSCASTFDRENHPLDSAGRYTTMKLMYVRNPPSMLCFSYVFQLSRCWRPDTSGSNQPDDSGCQGELLKIFVVLDVCIDRFPDDLRSLRSKLFEPLTVFFVLVLRLFLLPETKSALAPITWSKKRGVGFQTARSSLY